MSNEPQVSTLEIANCKLCGKKGFCHLVPMRVGWHYHIDCPTVGCGNDHDEAKHLNFASKDDAIEHWNNDQIQDAS